jgi:hypothetical protein
MKYPFLSYLEGNLMSVLLVVTISVLVMVIGMLYMAQGKTAQRRGEKSIPAQPIGFGKTFATIIDSYPKRAVYLSIFLPFPFYSLILYLTLFEPQQLGNALYYLLIGMLGTLSLALILPYRLDNSEVESENEEVN